VVFISVRGRVSFILPRGGLSSVPRSSVPLLNMGFISRPATPLYLATSFELLPHQTFSTPLSSPLHPTRAPLLTVFFINLRHHVFPFTISPFLPSPGFPPFFGLLSQRWRKAGRKDGCVALSIRPGHYFPFFFNPLPPLCNHAFPRLPCSFTPLSYTSRFHQFHRFSNVYVLLTEQQPLSDRKLSRRRRVGVVSHPSHFLSPHLPSSFTSPFEVVNSMIF